MALTLMVLSSVFITDVFSREADRNQMTPCLNILVNLKPFWTIVKTINKTLTKKWMFNSWKIQPLLLHKPHLLSYEILW